MNEECNHDCASCKEKCSSQSMIEPLNEYSRVKKVIGVVSGKGGVGKSLVTSLLALATSRNNLRTAILDADITGPSIPSIFGIKDKVRVDENGFIVPAVSKNKVDIISTNLILDDPTTPVVWRGPIIANMVRQFWQNVLWKDIDIMFVDMPPGTGDVPLTVYQSIPLDGIVVVTSPQQMVGMIVEKAINMAKMMNIPILGIVENMSYYVCDECGQELKIFGDSNLEKIASKNGISVICKIPIDPSLTRSCDNGNIEAYNGEFLNQLFSIVGNV